ncbi:alkaline phosphatase family protein [Curtobacterium ammoniigenes]|uniref:alkaline phosphatase family protein n=1 Tax=Curtobacterium ammoniigenes TaxID=395387 RepID=UPI000830E879|nr:nucleotide pyrophosphatase/phosphodiesterase family protein [Curtobacterium ammoniigenes]
MAPSVPTLQQDAANLADVLPSALRALGAVDDEWLERVALRGRIALPDVRSCVVVVVDGLGANALAARRGHARFLTESGRRLRTGFPTTTAAALTSLSTGRSPGEHGVVGYSGWVDERHDVVNMLSGWNDRVPEGWLATETLFETATALGVDAVAVGPSRYRSSGFTRSVLAGARYVEAERIEDRVAAAARVVAEAGRHLVYLYIPELDAIAHRHGWQSDRWTAALETVDAALAVLASSVVPDAGVLVTADHGILDVPESANIALDADTLDAVRGVAGDPRARQLTLHERADAPRVAEAFQASLGKAAFVATFEQAAEAGWFGIVRPELRDRFGDVVIVARGTWAFNDDRALPPGAVVPRMVGQHGGLTDDELFVPLRLAAGFSRG